MKTSSVKSSCFTLIELMVAMGVFSIIMFVLISFFSNAQKAMTSSISRNETFENAAIAMDMLTKELQCALYNAEDSEKGIYPFWHEADDKINFIAMTNLHDTTNDTSDVCEIKYTRSNGTTTADDLGNGDALKTGWLVRSVTGDHFQFSTNRDDQNNKYNFALYPRSNPADASYDATHKNQRIYRIWKAIDGSTATAFKSSDDFRYIIPFVVELKFTCYNKQMQDMVANSIYSYPAQPPPNTSPMTPFPYCVRIDLTLLDKSSWQKWISLGGDAATPSNDTGNVLEYRQNNQRTFSKMIYIGDRKSN